MSDLRERFEAKLKAGHRYHLRNCSMCGYQCGWYVDKEGDLWYDSGCDCTRRGYVQNWCEWSDLDFYFDPSHGHLENFDKWVNE